MKDLKEEMLKKIALCEDKLTVKEACGLFISNWDGLEKHTNSIKNVKNKVSEGEWNAFVNAILFTLFGSFYFNCEISEEEQKKRAQEFYETFKDLIVGAAISQEKN